MPDRPATYRDIIQHEAQAAGIPPEVAFAIVDTESSGDDRAVGAVVPGQGQARGFFQLMPATAQGYGVDAADPVQNIRGGIRLLADLNSQYKGDVRQMLAAYHGGQDLRQHGPKTQAYVQRVLGRLSGGQPEAPGGNPAARVAGRTPAFRADPAGEAAKIGAPPPTALPTLARTPMVSPTEFEGPSSRTEEVLAAGKAVAQGFNPMRPEGRRNIAGAVGATVAGSLAAPTGPGAIAAGAAGAGAFAAAETAVENQIRGVYDDNPAIAGLTQAGMELGGRALIWPARAVGRRLVAHPVAQAASKHLTRTRDAAMQAFDRAMDATRGVAAATRTSTARTLREARAHASSIIAGAADRANAGVLEATAVADGARAAARGIATPPPQFAPPPGRTAVGQQVQAVVEGPAKSVLDEYGAAVREVAESGPALPLTAAREKAQRIFDEQIQGVATYFSGTPQQAMDPELAGYIKNAFGNVAEADRAAFIAKLTGGGVPPPVAEATFESAKHPAMGVLRRVVNAPGDVPFAAAHQLKTELAAAVNWESPARGIVKQSTKAVHQALREDLGTYAPYNEATARYAQTVPLFGKGHVAALRKQAIEEPGKFLGRIKPEEPHQLRMLREVLVGLPGKTGDPKAAQAGQQAWDAVRAQWTHERLLKKGGIDTLAQRIDALPAEFSSTLYGDPAGQQVLQNLRAIAQAYKEGLVNGSIQVDAVDAAAKAAIQQARISGADVLRATRTRQRDVVEAVRRQGEDARDAVAGQLRGQRTARRLAKQQTPDEVRFETSSIFPDKQARSLEGAFADVVRAIMLGPTKYWGAYSMGRLLHGPKSAELIEWAAYSPQHTQQLVQLLTGSAPPRVAANLLRALQADQGMEGAVRWGVGAAPPNRDTLAITIRSDDTHTIGTPPPTAKTVVEAPARR